MTSGDLHVSLDTRVFDRKLGRLPKQIPYALSVAISATAADAVTEVKARLSDDFTVRTPWLAKGIRYSPANKRRLSALIGSVDRFMDEQAVGGERESISHEHGPGVPLVGKGRARAKPESTTRPSRWPQALAKTRDDVFIGTRKYADDEREGVWQRIMVGRGRNRREGLRLLYAIVPKVIIRPRWRLLPVVEGVVRRRWAKNADAAIRKAIDTAR